MSLVSKAIKILYFDSLSMQPRRQEQTLSADRFLPTLCSLCARFILVLKLYDVRMEKKPS